MTVASTPSKARRPASRYLVACLPDLPTDRLHRLQAEPVQAGLVLITPQKGAWQLTAVDATARQRGLALGMGLAHARALCPDLMALEADPAADLHLLYAMADWALRYTPLVGVASPSEAVPTPHMLILDITGCAHLFEGEERMAADLAWRLERQGFLVRIGVASTIGMAVAIALYGGGGVVAAGQERAQLSPFPLAALRLATATLDALSRMGLRRIGDVLQAPRAPLTARFGVTLLTQLARALGEEDEPFSPRLPVPPYLAERRFAEPILSQDDIRMVAFSLLSRLSESLEAQGEGALRLKLTLFRTDGVVRVIEAGLSRPTRDAQIMQEILCQRLDALADALNPGFGFDCLTIALVEVAKREAEALTLMEPDLDAGLARFIDRVGARIGRGKISRFMAEESHVPERAAFQVAGATAGDPAQWGFIADHGPPLRPIRLFARPERVETLASVPDGPPIRFRWRRVMHTVARVEGPERISAEWWTEPEGLGLTRDYFRVEDQEGRRFWMFRDGLYGVEAAHPNWFVHGLFA